MARVPADLSSSQAVDCAWACQQHQVQSENQEGIINQCEKILEGCLKNATQILYAQARLTTLWD